MFTSSILNRPMRWGKKSSNFFKQERALVCGDNFTPRSQIIFFPYKCRQIFMVLFQIDLYGSLLSAKATILAIVILYSVLFLDLKYSWLHSCDIPGNNLLISFLYIVYRTLPPPLSSSVFLSSLFLFSRFKVSSGSSLSFSVILYCFGLFSTFIYNFCLF